MRNAVSLAALVVIVALCGCVSSIEERSTARGGLGLSLGDSPPDSVVAPSDGTDEHDVLCVMEVPGTGIRMRNVDGGLAVVFDTVTRGSVADLRRAVRGFGAALASGHHADHRGHHSPRALALAAQFHAATGPLPAMLTSVRDVPGGARLDIRAADPAQRAVVVRRMREEIGVMQRGVCPLLGE